MKIKQIIKNFFKTNKRTFYFEEIDYAEIQNLLNSNSDAILIDVRSEQEYKEGHLPNAINIPVYELVTKVPLKFNDKNKSIILYCQTGSRSKKGIEILKNKGYSNLYSLKGGLEEIEKM